MNFSMNLDTLPLLSRLDLDNGTIAGRPRLERRLADLRECFADKTAYAAALARDNPLVYTVASVEPASGEGDLHYGLGVIHAGTVGNEYWMTKGHLHAWRPAAEYYIGLRGEGAMLLEDEATGESRLVPLAAQSVVYVPGSTAHRTMNTGREPLVYLGIYPARAGHDYAAIATRNFRFCVVARDGRPALVPRTEMTS
jgi:glucose-6-phosphate isomerase